MLKGARRRSPAIPPIRSPAAFFVARWPAISIASTRRTGSLPDAPRAGVAKGPLPAGHEAENFERISWDEALDTIAQRLTAIAEQYGPESILPYSYAGTIGVLGYGSMDRRFFHRLGASQLDRTICATAGGDAILSVYGRKLGTDTEQFHRARLIIAWGANIHGNNVHLWPQIEEARRNGARLIVIDPYQTRTANWPTGISPFIRAPTPRSRSA